MIMFKIAEDKKRHLYAGLLIGCLGTSFSIQARFWWSILIVFGLVLIIGLVKEMYDFIKKGKFNLADILFTIAGGFISYIIMRIIPMIISNNFF